MCLEFIQVRSSFGKIQKPILMLGARKVEEVDFLFSRVHLCQIKS